MLCREETASKAKIMTVIERASTDASTCQSVRKNSAASLGLLKRLNGKCSRHNLISSGTRYQLANKPANPTSKIHKKAYRGVSKAALTLAFVQPTILSDLLVPPALICSRLASRIREDPGRSLHKP